MMSTLHRRNVAKKNDPGTVNECKEYILSLMSEATNDDISIIYVGGHGGTATEKFLQYGSILAPSNEVMWCRHYKEIADSIPGMKIFIIDTCHSGGLADYFRFLNRKDVCVLTSTNVESSTTSMPGEETSYLMHYILKGLDWKSNPMPADANEDNQVTFTELRNYVRRYVTYDTSHLSDLEKHYTVHEQFPQYYMPDDIDPVIYIRDSWCN